MISLLFCGVLSFPGAVSAPVSAPVIATSEDPELDAKIKAAGNDTAKLIELAKSYASAGKPDNANKVYKKVLEIDAGNEAAHKGLNHQLYDKKWFESFAELAKYKREEAAKLKGQGMAKWKGELVPEGDIPFLNMGWTKDEKGVWHNPADVARDAEIAKWKSENYEFRADDNSWVAPADKDKWATEQWKCGDQWVDTAKANEYHSKIGQWWQLSGDHFITWTTCDWAGGHIARWHADQTYPDLVRIFGVEPASKPHLIVLNGLEQYNTAAGGQPPLIPESEGISSLHGAYFADLFYDAQAKPPQFQGCGVSYWDRKDTKLGAWGPYWLRWAAAQSYVDAIDPSWNAISEQIANAAATPGAATAFWTEKKIPRWLRYGAASYVERYMKNPEAAKGTDPWGMRAFAFAEVKKAGGLHKLDDVFAFQLDLNKAENSTRLYQEAGLLVSYLLDGSEGNKELAKKHEAFKAALKSGKTVDVMNASDALQKELVKEEPKIKKFAGL